MCAKNVMLLAYYWTNFCLGATPRMHIIIKGRKKYAILNNNRGSGKKDYKWSVSIQNIA